MTLFHFGNCIALVYVPYYLTYKYSGLSEYGAFWKCFQSGGIYIFTQLCKMLVLASFIPDTESISSSGEYNLIAEFLRCSVDLADLVGLAFVLSRIPGKGHNKLITAGLGWAAAEVILSRGLMLWIGARGAEFHWNYIQRCLESNILLIQHITTATLLWLFSRHDLDKKLVPLVPALLAVINYRGVWLDSVLRIIPTGAWFNLSIKAVSTCSIGVVTLHMYTGLAKLIDL